MKTLAIETSCDDTSFAIIDYENKIFNPEKVLLHSQIEKHRKFGGVVPELASRLHEEKIVDLLEELGLDNIKKVDFISYTCCPGLPGSLLVGKTLAYTLSKFLNKPLVGVNHIVGHIFSLFVERKLEDILFPVIVLTVSGGHNELYLVSHGEFNSDVLEEYLKKLQDNYGLHKEDLLFSWGKFKLYKLGFTLDDAAGEAFDKVSKMLGGPYPGGKWIYDLAKENKQDVDFSFPRIWLKKNEFLFSFSGLKAQVNYKIKELEKKGNLTDEEKSKIAYEFQNATIEVLGKKLLKAAKYFGVENVAVVGGVSANQFLKEFIQENLGKFQVKNFYFPVKSLYSTDNGAMIGVAGLIKYLNL